MPELRPTASLEDDSSLDSALSAQGAPRKASLKPDHMRSRRPVQPLDSTTMPPRARPAAGPGVTASTVSRPTIILPQTTHADGVGANQASPNEAVPITPV